MESSRPFPFSFIDCESMDSFLFEPDKPEQHILRRERANRWISMNGVKEDGAADGNRTHDLRLTKASLYPLATAAIVGLRIGPSLIKVTTTLRPEEVF